FEADDDVVFYLQIDAALLPAETAVGGNQAVGFDAGVDAGAAGVGEVRSKSFDGGCRAFRCCSHVSSRMEVIPVLVAERSESGTGVAENGMRQIRRLAEGWISAENALPGSALGQDQHSPTATRADPLVVLGRRAGDAVIETEALLDLDQILDVQPRGEPVA